MTLCVSAPSKTLLRFALKVFADLRANPFDLIETTNGSLRTGLGALISGERIGVLGSARLGSKPNRARDLKFITSGPSANGPNASELVQLDCLRASEPARRKSKRAGGRAT